MFSLREVSTPSGVPSVAGCMSSVRGENEKSECYRERKRDVGSFCARRYAPAAEVRTFRLVCQSERMFVKLEFAKQVGFVLCSKWRI